MLLEKGGGAGEGRGGGGGRRRKEEEEEEEEKKKKAIFGGQVEREPDYQRQGTTEVPMPSVHLDSPS